MFNFFTTGKWLLWSWGGLISIFGLIYYQVTLDVEITYWFKTFYDMIQTALSTPNSVTIEEYFGLLLTFGKIAGLYIATAVFVTFLASHFVFRWRTSMVEWYHSVYDEARHIEGASQRVQEDTIKFARILESLGTSLIESVLLLIAFFPILITISKGIPIMWFGDWEFGLVTGSIAWALVGTLFLVALAYILRLVGVEYDIQKREASYRKLLVIAEDDGTIRPKSFHELYQDVKKIHYSSYLRYLWFNTGKASFSQASVLVAYVLLAPAIVAAALTYGTMQQIIRAFNRVESSLQFLIKSWPLIIELLSVYKRLREFEKEIKSSKRDLT